MSDFFHVYPIEDEKPHDTENGGICACNPSLEVEENGNCLVTHNSYDGREWNELSSKKT